jgi:hypothetical protein
MINWLINMFDMILLKFTHKSFVKIPNHGQNPRSLKG